MFPMPKVKQFYDWGYQIKGLIHAGANDGEEVPGYLELGIRHLILFEPLASAWAKAASLETPEDCEFTVDNAALSDYDGESHLNVTPGHGKASSLLDNDFKHPEIKAKWDDQTEYIGKQFCHVRRFDSWAEANKEMIDLANYDCLVLDTQGNELEVLKGCGKLLKNFKFLTVELSDKPIYKGEHAGQEVIDWLDKQGFKQNSPLVSHDDVFFIRKDIYEAA